MKPINYKIMPLYFLACWLPAIIFAGLTTLFPGISTTLPSVVTGIIRWVLALFMLGGWAYLIYLNAGYRPITTLGGILLFLGINLLLIAGLYLGWYNGARFSLLHFIAGFSSYTPLGCVLGLIVSVFPPTLSLPLEFFLVILMLIVFLASWFVGRAKGRPSE